MTTEITKFRQKEKIRRLYFRFRGDINAIIEETGLDENYIRKTTNKIRKSFRHDVNFEIACFITDAILEGREQRKILLEDRLFEVLKKKKRMSVCCSFEVSEDTWENEPVYNCQKCGKHCKTKIVDYINDNTVIKLIDRMRKEDEFIGKFLAAMGIIAKDPNSITSADEKNGRTSPPPAIQVQSKETLPPAEKKLLEKLGNLDESKISEIRRFVESKVDEASNES